VAERFSFRPRYRGIAFSAIGVGGVLAAVAITSLGGALVPLGTGALGVALGAIYLRSPTWRLEVVVDDTALEVRGPKGSRFRLPWPDVVRVVASPTTHTCFVDGGAAENSLLVPGDGAPAPYDIADKIALYDAIVAHVAPDKITTVPTLEAAR
jgi:hypothetical protein